MPFGSSFASDILKLLFTVVNIANLADNTATSPLTSLYLSLHTADPSAGNQQTSETSYTSYGRVAVARTTGGWTVTANAVSPVATITFPACSGGSATITHAAVGTTTTGNAGKVLFSGTVTPNIAVSNGVTPSLTTASTITLT